MRLEASRLWRLIGRGVQWCRVRRGQAGWWLAAEVVAKRSRRAVAMMKRTCGMLREATRAKVRLRAALPQRQRWTGRSENLLVMSDRGALAVRGSGRCARGCR